jgi:hypothetical protein
MSDYARIDVWTTACGATVKLRAGRWRAQFKGRTSRWHATAADAMVALERDLAR